MLLKTLFVILSLFIALPTYAQLFRLKVTDYGCTSGPLCTQFQTLIDGEVAKIEADINKDLPNAQPTRLMEGMANSSVMAGKGVGKDYSSYMETFLIGVGAGVGADLEKSKDPKSDLSGAGVAPGVVVGLNLSFMDTARILGMDTNHLNLYFNFMSYNHKMNFDDKSKKSSAELNMMTAGVHLRYDWVKPRGSKLFGWGGVKFHMGYEYNKTDILFSSQINESVDTTSGSGPTEYQISGNVSGNPQALINVATHSIPFELSTDIRILYILSLYGGVGIDYNMGEAQGRGALNADPSTISCSGGAACTAAGNPDAEVQATANINTKAKVKPFLYRAFAGAQINLPYFRVYGQVDKSLGDDLIGVTGGVRFVF